MNHFSNEEIADQLKLISKLMDLHDENSFKSKTFSNASFQIDKWKIPLIEMKDSEILKIISVGTSVLAVIKELIDTGSIKILEELLEKTPIGLMEMMKIKGIGPKKLRTIWMELEIEDVGELLYACNENRLVELKGFGEKTQNEIIKQIQFINQNKHKFFYAEGLIVAETLLQILHQNFDEQFELTGNIRRKNTVLECIELISTQQNEMELIECLETISEISNVNFDDENLIVTCNYMVRFPIKITLSEPQYFIFNWFNTTASSAHLQLIENIEFAEYENEAEIYESINLPYIEPELREGTIEIDLAIENNLPILIEERDIKGVVHCHSKYSDGKNTIKELAETCIAKGFEYLCLSDHSQSATYADGLKADKIIEQHKEIDALNSTYQNFKIFKGIESDILYNGDLDYPEDVLKTFDFVIASVHSTLKMNEETAMRRLIKAIENPYTTILGHPTGRLLLSREGYPINHKKIIDACAANNVIIELNASPYRLDMDWQWIPYAIEKNVMISINPDAHDLSGIDDIKYGIAAARKGFLYSVKCFNSKGLREIENYFQKNKK
ncbi:MAG: polymerase/3-5 exonuclease PolX [Bacteroidota bacterium]|jgi:DNA polymerase (family 10)